MNRRKLILVLTGLFIAVNCFLVYLDDDENVQRLSYIDEWSVIGTKDMYETIETAGVLASAATKNVYFDEEKGSFLEFQIKDGAKINIGDPLFTYEPRNYYDTKAQLESEVSKLNGQIAAIEEAIANISAFQAPPSDLEAQFEGENAQFDLTHEPVEVEYMKEAYIAEKEKELAQKQAELESIQAQLSDLESTGDTITVESPYQGQVTNLSESLNNPVVTIRDQQLQATGRLTENERMKVEPEMPVEVDIQKNDSVLQGTLSSIDDMPETVNIHTTSMYPFEVKFEENSDMEGLLPGYHADLKITTNASPDATVVQGNQLLDKNVWKMTSEGFLQKQKVETGIHMDNFYEIKQGANPGEWAAQDDWDQFRDGAVFITGLNVKDIQWKRIGKYDNVSWKRYFITGLLAR
ncbi:efflux RND transporter periplasmic adaptor subunit [Virgibacillus ihumii]|uniref:efflux RND transporter periplasmic adaptor subunit n=1 Tax=Virgibacillus ihumii TaxID=2686091 RepID=UPI00157DDE94|nr:HlyD family efflux transporter periplasmic adaptor subunit [Virgibacillus ihumii]